MTIAYLLAVLPKSPSDTDRTTGTPGAKRRRSFEPLRIVTLTIRFINRVQTCRAEAMNCIIVFSIALEPKFEREKWNHFFRCTLEQSGRN